MAVIERREQRAARARRAEEHRAGRLPGCGVRDSFDADRTRVVAVAQVVMQLVGQQPADEHREHEQPQRAGKAREREDAREHEHEKGRDRGDHVAVEEERGVARRRHDGEEDDGRRDGQHAEADDAVAPLHEQCDETEKREHREVVEVVGARCDEMACVLPHRLPGEGPPACCARRDAIAVTEHVQRA